MDQPDFLALEYRQLFFPIQFSSQLDLLAYSTVVAVVVVVSKRRLGQEVEAEAPELVVCLALLTLLGLVALLGTGLSTSTGLSTLSGTGTGSSLVTSLSAVLLSVTAVLFAVVAVVAVCFAVVVVVVVAGVGGRSRSKSCFKSQCQFGNKHPNSVGGKRTHRKWHWHPRYHQQHQQPGSQQWQPGGPSGSAESVRRYPQVSEQCRQLVAVSMDTG